MRFLGRKCHAKKAQRAPSSLVGDQLQVRADRVSQAPQPAAEEAAIVDAAKPVVVQPKAVPGKSEQRLATVTRQFHEARLALQAVLFARREAAASRLQDALNRRQATLKHQEMLLSHLEALAHQDDQRLIAQRDELSAKMASTTARLDATNREQAHEQQELSRLDEQIQASKKATAALLDDLKTIGDQLCQVGNRAEIMRLVAANRKAVSEMHPKLAKLNQQKAALEATKRKVGMAAKNRERAVTECVATLTANRQESDRIEHEIQAAQKHRQVEVTAIKTQLADSQQQLDAQEQALSADAAAKQRADEEVQLWLGTANRIIALPLNHDVPVVLVVDAFAPDDQGGLRHLAIRLEHCVTAKLNLAFGVDVGIADMILAWLAQAGLQPTQVNVYETLLQLQNTKSPVKAIKLSKIKEEIRHDAYPVCAVVREEDGFVLEITYRDSREELITSAFYYANGTLMKLNS